ncbi:Fc.00g083140.m01.CDS01 [Cosmosporella sp. VM-42]
MGVDASYKLAGVGGKGGVVTGVIWAENVLSYSLIGLRIYTRRYIRGKLGWDDVCLVIVAILMTVFAILITVSAVHGMGQHVDNLETTQFAKAVFFLLCSQTVVSMAIGMGKVVVAVFLLRIVTANWHKWFLWFCIVSMLILSILLSVAVFVQCTPVQSIWDPLLADQKVCYLSLTAVAFIDCSYAAAMDFALAAFPWVALRGLNMKRKERITICVSLSLGIFAGICGVIRTSGLEALSNSADYLFATSDSVVWTASEVTTTIVCVTLPALRPLYNKMRGQESSSAGYRQHDDSAYGTGGSYNLSSFPAKRNDVIPYQKNNNTFATAESSRDPNEIRNDSDETILLQGDKQNIMRVQEVTVSYENANSENSVSVRQAV